MMIMRALLLFPALPLLVLACGGGDTDAGSNGAGGLVNGGGGNGGWGSTTSTSSTSSSSSTSTGTGGGSSSGQGGDCLDLGVGEMNNSEDTAFKLKAEAISDCDGSGSAVSGTIAGADDVDWFYYEGNDQAGCVVDPTRGLDTDVTGLRLCVFFQCLNGNTDVTCPSFTTSAVSPHQRSGCCSTSSFSVEDLDCTGTWDEHVYTYIRIDDPAATEDTCSDYSLSYHY